jgi:hypothetical protein
VPIQQHHRCRRPARPYRGACHHRRRHPAPPLYHRRCGRANFFLSPPLQPTAWRRPPPAPVPALPIAAASPWVPRQRQRVRATTRGKKSRSISAAQLAPRSRHRGRRPRCRAGADFHYRRRRPARPTPLQTALPLLPTAPRAYTAAPPLSAPCTPSPRRVPPPPSAPGTALTAASAPSTTGALNALGLLLLGRAVGPRPMSGCGPGTRATCSAVLSGALEAYPPLGTTPGVLVLGGGGWWRVAGYLLAGYWLFCRVPLFFWSWWRASCEKAFQSLSGLICSFCWGQCQRRPAVGQQGSPSPSPPSSAANLSNKDVIFSAVPLGMGIEVIVCSQSTKSPLLI